MVARPVHGELHASVAAAARIRRLAALLGLSLLAAMPANAAKDVFIRNKPRVMPHVMPMSSTFVGGGTQGACHDDPWKKHPKFRCVKPKDSPALYCK